MAGGNRGPWPEGEALSASLNASLRSRASGSPGRASSCTPTTRLARGPSPRAPERGRYAPVEADLEDHNMKRRHETFMDKLSKYQGILLVSSVPVLLILVVVFMMPRGMPGAESSFSDDTLDRVVKQRSSEEALKYAVIIDAGSTGSRIHVYKFDGKMELQEIDGELELFVKIKPGLSAYKDTPKDAANSLRELLDKALNVVPETLRPSTPVVVGATAGLRLLPGDAAENILNEVRTMLNEYPFTVGSNAVKILDGADEGSFAWVTVNYLLGHLGQDVKETVGVIDLGGGSVQMTYAISDSAASAAPDGYVRKLSGLGKAYNVYVHSYLGFGLMAARAAILKLKQEADGHACVVKGASDKYKYGNDELDVKSRADGSNHADCHALAKEALKVGDQCSFKVCSFGGVWSGGGGDGAQKLYVASYFFDRAGQFGVIPDPDASSAPAKPSKFKEAAEKVCSTPLEKIAETFPKLDQKDAPYACLDASYQHALLTAGFGLEHEQEVTLVKQITYKNKEVEAAWPLGAAIDALSA